jgi:hypothetical protein
MTGNGKAPHDPLDIFIKMLGMTTSDNDGQALVAIRKANQYLSEKLRSDWEAFVRGKIKVEADPFAAAPVVAPKGTTMNMGATPTASAPRYTPPPPTHHKGPEVQEWIDRLSLRTLPGFIQRRLNDIEKSWGRNGYLLQADYEELRRLANQKKRYRP